MKKSDKQTGSGKKQSEIVTENRFSVFIITLLSGAIIGVFSHKVYYSSTAGIPLNLFDVWGLSFFGLTVGLLSWTAWIFLRRNRGISASGRPKKEKSAKDLGSFFLQSIPVPAILIRADNFQYKFMNDAARKLFELSGNDFTGKTDHDFFEKIEADRLGQAYQEILSKKFTDRKFSEVALNLRGKTKILRMQLSEYSAQNTGENDILALLYDVTEEHEQNKLMRQQKEYLKVLEDSFNVLWVVLNAKGEVVRFSHSCELLTGYTFSEIAGKRIWDVLMLPEEKNEFHKSFLDSINNKTAGNYENYWVSKNGTTHKLSFSSSVLLDIEGKVEFISSIAIDITANMQAEETIRNLAFYDSLTRLPNRGLLMDRLYHALVKSSRSGLYGALLFLDIDHFKSLNDRRGHAAGDLLLVEVAKRLQFQIRADDTLARLGGDEFIIIQEALSTDAQKATAQAEVIAAKISEAVNQSITVKGEEYRFTISIGITLFLGQKDSVEELIKRADSAMYQAKNNGRNTVCFFDPITQEAINTRLEIGAVMRKTFPEHYTFHYQGQIDMNGKIIGAEALLRWDYPEKPVISTQNLIFIAEENGFISEIDSWVIEGALATLKLWENNPLTQDLVLAINLSANKFRQAYFVSDLLSEIEKQKVNPTRLKMELTEGMLLENIDMGISIMHKLKDAGIKLAVDDFGTGYSSLSYLKRLPLDQLKLDQSFVKNMVYDQRDAALVQTMIGMGSALGIEIIAEGVETLEQFHKLQELGCNYYQGFLFGKPVAFYDFLASMEKLK